MEKTILPEISNWQSLDEGRTVYHLFNNNMRNLIEKFTSKRKNYIVENFNDNVIIVTKCQKT